jgi:hypothetical protein
MTTKSSPKRVLRAQADKIAANLKAAERGEATDPCLAKAVEEARERGIFKVAIVMDDKIISLDLPFETIRTSSEAGLSAYILDLMREKRRTMH